MASDRNVRRTKSFDGSGNSLGSMIYRLVVGPEKKLFYSHEAVLSQSPVFERMCNGSFKESVEQQIELPDDDADIFGRVLEFMYRGVFDGFETPTQNGEVAMLADLYILAEKYQLSGLKELLIPPLATILDDASEAECIESFFDAARKIYENTPDSEVLFPESFKETVAKMLGYSDRAPCMEAQIKLTIYGGGKLAQDAFDAYFTHLDNAHTIDNKLADEREEVAKAKLQRQINTLQTKHDRLERGITTVHSTNSSLLAHHSFHHRHCIISDLSMH